MKSLGTLLYMYREPISTHALSGGRRARLEGPDELRGQVGDEADRVRQDDLAPARQRRAPRRGVQRLKQPARAQGCGARSARAARARAPALAPRLRGARRARAWQGGAARLGAGLRWGRHIAQCPHARMFRPPRTRCETTHRRQPRHAIGRPQGMATRGPRRQVQSAFTGPGAGRACRAPRPAAATARPPGCSCPRSCSRPPPPRACRRAGARRAAARASAAPAACAPSHPPARPRPRGRRFSATAACVLSPARQGPSSRTGTRRGCIRRCSAPRHHRTEPH